jgi:hypothetical protein
MSKYVRGGRMLWKMEVRRLKGVRKDNEHRVCPICSKAEVWGHMLRCEGTKIWRNQILGKRFKNIDPEIEIRRIV